MPTTGSPPPPFLIQLTTDEQRAGQLSPMHLQQATLMLECSGLVVLRGALPPELVDRMKQQYDAIVDDCRASLAGKSLAELPWRSDGGTVFWIVNARLRAFIRLKDAFADPRVVANPFASAVMDNVLGRGFYCNSISSDTCLQGSTWQAPHRDIGFQPPGRPSGTIVNIALMHCGLHNGPLEVWPGGSHLWRAESFSRYGLQPFDQDKPNPAMERFAAQLPSLRLDLRPGDVLLRDPAMLHRGTPNTTPEPRVMLTIGYFREGVRYAFGDPRDNVDAQAWEALDPRVRTLMAHRVESGMGYPAVRR